MRAVGIALVALGAVGAVGSAMAGVSNLAAIHALAAGIAIVYVTRKDGSSEGGQE